MRSSSRDLPVRLICRDDKYILRAASFNSASEAHTMLLPTSSRTCLLQSLLRSLLRRAVLGFFDYLSPDFVSRVTRGVLLENFVSCGCLSMAPFIGAWTRTLPPFLQFDTCVARLSEAFSCFLSFSCCCHFPGVVRLPGLRVGFIAVCM